MFNIIKKLKQNKKGYIAIEIIIIAAFFVSLGAFLIFNYVDGADKIAAKPMIKTDELTTCMHNTGNPVCNEELFVDKE